MIAHNFNQRKPIMSYNLELSSIENFQYQFVIFEIGSVFGKLEVFDKLIA